jgi:putative endonuclease
MKNYEPRHFYIYIITNQRNTVLYTGVTNNLIRRILEHKKKINKGFTSRYNCNKLVYYETYDNPNDAIAREKQIKAGSRKRKIKLIESKNPNWRDLYSSIMIH